MTGINHQFRLVSRSASPATEEIQELAEAFPNVPAEYISYVMVYGEFEVMWDEYGYLRIWRPGGCLEMYRAYHMARYIDCCLPIADNGGGKFLAYRLDSPESGIYKFSYSDIDIENAIFIADSLGSILSE